MSTINLVLRVWRQQNGRKRGRLERYEAKNISTHASFLEMLDVVNERLVAKGKEPIAFDSDCREDVGLLDREEGESHFLPIIGEGHVAAMPYEIILVNKKATMLHGRYRFALHWPELTMKTFTKIMSSPGDVEDAMEALTK